MIEEEFEPKKKKAKKKVVKRCTGIVKRKAIPIEGDELFQPLSEQVLLQAEYAHPTKGKNIREKVGVTAQVVFAQEATPPSVKAMHLVAEESKPELELNPKSSAIKRFFKRNFRQYAFIAAGLILAVIFFFFASLYGQQRDNMFLAMGVVVTLPGSIFLIWRGFRRPDLEAVIVGSNKPTTKVNSLNIYAYKDGDTGLIYPKKIAFEWIDKPKGQPQQCLNNNNWYYVNVYDLKEEVLKPMVLPDRQYFDPREFANVIKMPAHKRLFERQISLIQKVGPWVMVIAFMASLFGMIATAPTGG